MSICEYNPKHKKPSVTPPTDGDCPNQATTCVGRKGAWHLCDSCAALPEFKSFRARTPLKRQA